MAQLAYSALADLRRAVDDGRSGIVVGPSRSGLTWLVNQQATIGFDPLTRLSLRGAQTVDLVKVVVRKALGLGALPDRPSDVQLALADRQVEKPSRLIVVNDCHRASPEALAWLFQAALEPVAGVARPAVPFVFEGAFDPDGSLGSAFPSGSPDQPLIHYVESAIPWRTLTEVEEIVRARWRPSFTNALIPWLADVSGGDVGLVQEILERLPNDGVISDDTLAAATRHVAANGPRAREIRESVQYIANDELLRGAITGRGIPGVMPSALESGAVKRAYLAGVLVFDGIGSVYRVRGPVAALVLANALGVKADTVFESRFILARLLIFFAHIAAFELDVRSVLRVRGPKELAAAVSTETGLGRHRKVVRDAVVKACAPAPDALERLSEALKAKLPESMPLLEQMREKGGAEPTDDSILEELTFSQLVLVARQAAVFNAPDGPVLEEINDHRNTFAHFRSEPYGRCLDLLRAIMQARRILEKLG